MEPLQLSSAISISPSLFNPGHKSYGWFSVAFGGNPDAQYKLLVASTNILSFTGLKQTWEIGSFCMNTTRYVGKRE